MAMRGGWIQASSNSTDVYMAEYFHVLLERTHTHQSKALALFFAVMFGGGCN